MGLRKSGASREYDIIDVRFSNSTAAMAQKLKQMVEEQKARITANEEIKALTESLAEGMKIKVEEEEESHQRLEMIPEDSARANDAIPMSFGAEEAAVWNPNDSSVLSHSTLGGPPYLEISPAFDDLQNGTGLDWDELVPAETPSTSFDIETDDLYDLMSDLLSAPAPAPPQGTFQPTFHSRTSPMRHTHFSLVGGTPAYVPPLPQITSAAQLRMQQKEESYGNMLKPGSFSTENLISVPKEDTRSMEQRLQSALETVGLEYK